MISGEGLFALKACDITLSFLLHGLLLGLFFIVLPAWKKPEIPPVMAVKLVKLSVPKIKTTYNTTAPVKQPAKKKPVQKMPSRIPSAAAEKKQTQKTAQSLPEKKTMQDNQTKKQVMLQTRKEAEKEKKTDEEFLKNIQQITQKNLQSIPKLKAPPKEQNDSPKEKDATKTEQQVANCINLMRENISNRWQYPLDINIRMQATIKILLAPSGELIQVSLEKSSQNSSFDKSVLLAVKMAAPFSFLKQLDPHLFEQYFQTLTLIFSPQDLME